MFELHNTGGSTEENSMMLGEKDMSWILLDVNGMALVFHNPSLPQQTSTVLLLAFQTWAVLIIAN
jgi:hypothetical protein